jgi:hypothetical protein
VAFPWTDKPFLVINMWGQSNTGNGATIETAIDHGGTGSVEYGQGAQEGVLINQTRATEPIQGQGGSGVGPLCAFSRNFIAYVLAEYGSYYVLCCSRAVNGTSFTGGRWLVAGDLYEENIAHINGAMASGGFPGSNILLGTIAQFGESDGLAAMSQSTFSGHMDNFITDYRSRVTGAATAPFQLGGFSPDWVAIHPETAGVIASLQDTPNRHANTGYVSTAGLKGNAGDPLHFNTQSQRELGGRHFRKWCELSSRTGNYSGRF